MGDILQLQHKEGPDGEEAVWRAALEKVELDPKANIKHAVLDGGTPSSRHHVALIPNYVGSHYHRVGDETYEIKQGNGRLHYGLVTENADGSVASIDWQTRDVITGDSFVIPPGYAHQLENLGRTPPLVIIFSCPDSHLNDSQDRHFVEKSPFLGIRMASDEARYGPPPMPPAAING